MPLRNDLSTEHDLLLRLTVGDHAAFVEIYQLNWERFFRFALSLLKDEDKAQDLLQDDDNIYSAGKVS